MAVLAYLAWNGWQALGPQLPELDARRKSLATEIVSDCVEDLRTEAKEPSGLTAILHFEGDDSGFFSGELRRSIEQRGTLRLRGMSFGEKFRDLLGLSQHQYSSMYEAIERGRDLEVSAVLYGRINDLESYSGGGIADIEVALVQTSDGAELFAERYVIDTSEQGLSGGEIEARVSESHWFTKLAIWAVLVLLIPVVSFGFLRFVVRKETNTSRLLILGVLMLISVFLEFMIPLTAFRGWLSTVIFVILTILAYLYNYRMLVYAAELEGA